MNKQLTGASDGKYSVSIIIIDSGPATLTFVFAPFPLNTSLTIPLIIFKPVLPHSLTSPPGLYVFTFAKIHCSLSEKLEKLPFSSRDLFRLRSEFMIL